MVGNLFHLLLGSDRIMALYKKEKDGEWRKQMASPYVQTEDAHP